MLIYHSSCHHRKGSENVTIQKMISSFSYLRRDYSKLNEADEAPFIEVTLLLIAGEAKI